MKNITKASVIMLIALSSLNSANSTQHSEQYNSGVVNFNVNPSPFEGNERHGVSLYGCNTKVDTVVDWGKDNQVLAFVPYGKRVAKYKQNGADKVKNYHVSKYYLVSPPLFTPNSTTKQANIGLLTPDIFAFKGNKPSQIVNLDYNILQPTYLQFFPLAIDNSDCQSPKLTEFAVNIQCPNFPWFNGGEGASGIGFVENQLGKAQLFLPTLNEDGSKPLQCTISLLDDIMLKHQIFFNLDGVISKSIDITEFYNKRYKHQKHIPMVCKTREVKDVPAGCRLN